jgi:hypothetical protein
MLKYHLLIPLAVVAVLVVVGVPFGSAIFFGLVVGCMGMMVMMMRGAVNSEADRTAVGGDADVPTRDRS